MVPAGTDVVFEGGCTSAKGYRFDGRAIYDSAGSARFEAWTVTSPDF